ncbi:hypothetical protein CRUP_017638 [Coryphaenoides rupestris]|nr:hypothetical protein CRUP_017638 [Coryphaenoides rupestris]
MVLVMSLERFVAVCFPLRYASVVNVTSTYGAIAVVWAISVANTMFVSVGLIIVYSYVGVILAARSAATNKASANKARKTLLLHMIQLILSMYASVVKCFTSTYGAIAVVWAISVANTMDI